MSDENDSDYQSSIDKLKELSTFKFVHCSMKGIQSSPKNLLRAVNTFAEIVEKEKIDLIHTHSQSLCVVGAFVKLRTGVPYIWTNHIDEIANPKLFGKILKALRFPVISVSKDLKEMLINQYKVKEKRITVVNNGINPEKFPLVSDEEKEQLKDKFDCGEKYVVALLARMSYGKGHIYLLEAINKIQREYGVKDIKVLIAGKCHDSEKSYLEKLTCYAKEKGIDMNFLGFQNPRDVFGICNISVLPSIYEGFSLTSIESLAMGCPVIRSDTPGWTDMKDIVLVFPKKDVDKFSEHLYYAYTHQDEMKKMGREGKQEVLSKFTIEKQVDNTMKVYEKYICK